MYKLQYSRVATNPESFTFGRCWQELNVWSPVGTLIHAQRPGRMLTIVEIADLARQRDNTIQSVFPVDDQDVLRRLQSLLHMLIVHPLYEADVSAGLTFKAWQPLSITPCSDERPIPHLPAVRPDDRLVALRYAVYWLVGREVQVDLSSPKNTAATCLALEADLDGTATYEDALAAFAC